MQKEYQQFKLNQEKKQKRKRYPPRIFFLLKIHKNKFQSYPLFPTNTIQTQHRKSHRNIIVHVMCIPQRTTNINYMNWTPITTTTITKHKRTMLYIMINYLCYFILFQFYVVVFINIHKMKNIDQNIEQNFVARIHIHLLLLLNFFCAWIRIGGIYLKAQFTPRTLFAVLRYHP